MSSLNKVQIIGRIGQDPEVRFTQNNTAVANFSVATSERYKDKQGEQQENTEWHRIVAWGRTAEVIQKYGHKGQLVYIEGKLQTRKWEDKEGNTRYTTEINARTFTMLSRKDENPQAGGNNPSPSQPMGSNVDVGNVDDIDDDLPF